MNMKTGVDSDSPPLPLSFSIILLGLEGILKRVSFTDIVLFKNHNPFIILDSELFAKGVAFNLFSDFGIGKKIEPMIKDLFKNIEIEPENYLTNTFYKEIIRLTPVLSRIIQEGVLKQEVEWSYKYAVESIYVRDEIYQERLYRLRDIYLESYESSENISQEYSDENISNENMSDENISSENMSDEISYDICICEFCNEIRNYNPGKSANQLILDILHEIDSQVNG